MRKKEEIQKDIDKIDKLMWFLSMKDRWTSEDRSANEEYRRKLYHLNEELEECLSSENLSALTAEANV